jgi:hypothetical protein
MFSDQVFYLLDDSGQIQKQACAIFRGTKKKKN